MNGEKLNLVIADAVNKQNPSILWQAKFSNPKGQSLAFYLVTVARRLNIKDTVSVLNDELVD